MADFTPIATMVKPPEQLSLGDMVNIARGAQAYQQTAQTNPLQLRQQEAATSLAEDTLQPKISTAKSEASSAETGAQSAAMKLAQDQAKQISHGYIGVINAPEILEATNNPNGVDKQKLVNFVQNWANNQAAAAGIPKERTAELAAPYLKYAQENPAGLRNYFMQRTFDGLNDAAKVASFTTTKTLTPEGRQITRTPGIGTENIDIGLPGGIQAGKPPLNPSAMSHAFNADAPAPLPHQVQDPRVARIPDPTEAADTTAGVQLRQSLLGHLNNTAETNRNLNESFSAITKLDPGKWYTSGFAGNVVRTFKNLTGSSDYQQLSKDLANVQLSQLQAQGGSMQTDAAKTLQARASGTETYNPDVLLNIMKRTQAKQTELQLQAPALQLFSQKYGDSNAAKFQQEWSKNADSKIFEAMNINQYVTDPVLKKREIDALMGTDPKTRAAFARKYQNITKIMQNGSLD
jgi:hypothetical protein